MSRRAYAKLTAREELRMVALRAEGLTLAAIADRLGCSKASVCNALHKRAAESETNRTTADECPGAPS